MRVVDFRERTPAISGVIQGRGCESFSGSACQNRRGKEEEKKKAVKRKRLALSLSRLVDLDILLTVAAKGDGEWTLGVKTLVAHGVG